MSFSVSKQTLSFPLLFKQIDETKLYLEIVNKSTSGAGFAPSIRPGVSGFRPGLTPGSAEAAGGAMKNNSLQHIGGYIQSPASNQILY